MRISETVYSNGVRVYRRMFDENKVMYIYCFLIGFVVASIIAVAI